MTSDQERAAPAQQPVAWRYRSAVGDAASDWLVTTDPNLAQTETNYPNIVEPLYTAPSDTAPSPKGVSDGVRAALEAARAHIITLGGNPHPHDQSADQIQVAVLAVINAALSQEPVPATAEERAASKEGA